MIHSRRTDQQRHIPLTLSAVPKAPSRKQYRLATAIPSLLSKRRPVLASVYPHVSPAPASSRTETKKRSIKRRQHSTSSVPAALHLDKSFEMRSVGPTSKCCHLPCGGIDANCSGVKESCNQPKLVFMRPVCLDHRACVRWRVTYQYRLNHHISSRVKQLRVEIEIAEFLLLSCLVHFGGSVADGL